MKSKFLSVMIVGILLGSFLSGPALAASDKMQGLSVGMVFVDGTWHEFRFVKGKTPDTYDQIVLARLSGEAVGILAFKIRFDEANGQKRAVIENPLPIVTEESARKESLLFETLYAGLFSYLLLMRTDIFAQDLRIEFTDVPEGAVHPAISLTLTHLGFEADGGQTITIQIPKRPLASPPGMKGIQIPQFKSIHIGVSNRYTLSDLPQLRSVLDGILYAGTGN